MVALHEMNAQSKASKTIAVAQYPREKASVRQQSPAGDENSAASFNRGKPTQYLARCAQRIVVREGIPSRDPTGIFTGHVPADQPMNKKPALPHSQDNIPENHLLPRNAFDNDEISGPDRGQHADSSCFQSKRLAGTKNLGRELDSVLLELPGAA